MRNQRPQEAGVLRTGVWFVVIAMIITNTVRSILIALVNTYDGIQESRHKNRK